MKRILIFLGIIVGVIIISFTLFINKFSSITNMMKKNVLETGKINDDVYVIKDSFVNMFLIKNGDEYLAIDTGSNKDIIQTELKKMDIDVNKVTTILLTHTDLDHVGSISLFGNAKVYLSKEEELMLNGKKHKFIFMKNSISSKDYILLDNNQIINIGNIEIKCILAEGHTSGSMCYAINNKYLFTGDILSLKDGKIGESVKFFDMDHKMALSSISKITNLNDIEYIFTSHFGYSKDYINSVKDWK